MDSVHQLIFTIENFFYQNQSQVLYNMEFYCQIFSLVRTSKIQISSENFAVVYNFSSIAFLFTLAHEIHLGVVLTQN